MAKKKPGKRVTRSDFLRNALGGDPDLELEQINRQWAKAGHPGEISGPLYDLIRRELGIRSVWGRFPADQVENSGGRGRRGAERSQMRSGGTDPRQTTSFHPCPTSSSRRSPGKAASSGGS